MSLVLIAGMTSATDKKDRLNRLSTLIKGLPDKELAMVEAMLNSTRGSKANTPEPESFETVLASSSGQELLELLKQLQKTKIEFKLSQLKSFETPVEVRWEVQEIECYPMVSSSKLKASNYIAEAVVEEISNSFDEDSLEYLVPTRIRQDIEKERKKIDTAIAALEKKTSSFFLKEIPELQQATITIDFESLQCDYHDEVSFQPEIDWAAQGKKSPGYRPFYDSAYDAICDSYDSLADDLPKEIASELKAVDTLTSQIHRSVQAVNKAFPLWDYSEIVNQFCEHLS